MSSLDNNDTQEIQTPALIVALYLLVTTRLTGVQRKPAEYSWQQNRAMDILKELVGEEVEHKDVEEADVKRCMAEIRDQQWTQMDWFANIPVGAGVGDSGEEAADRASGDDKADDRQVLPMKRKKFDRSDLIHKEYLQAGLGTMVSSSYYSLIDVGEVH